MPRLTVNDRAEPQELPENWGALLNLLDERLERQGHVVTAVRFDGVVRPTFRGDADALLPLDGLALIEVETATPGELLDEALVEGAAGAAALAASAAITAQAFRTAGPEEGSRRLAAVGQGLHGLLAVMSGYSAARGVELDGLELDGRSVASRIRELVDRLEAVVRAQQDEDWLTVADVLDYELQPALEDWRAVFEGLRTAPAPGAGR